ncbi:MAG: TonB-dependent receptor plug domain-containing protein, partial [Novosphingobium sp.]
MKRSVLLASISLFAIGSQPAIAQDDSHHEPEEIVVTGALVRSREDVLSGVAVIQSENLAQAMRPSIGETLQNIPGVSATSFGPSASRPVLRGLQGERVRVLTGGIGAIDVSNTSVDHAVVVNPLLAERIEVLRGPQSLLYGAAAIGGVVNVIDRRLPSRLPDEDVHLGGIATYGSAASERSLSGSADIVVGEGLVFHADGSWSKSDDLRIGGFALSPALRAQ